MKMGQFVVHVDAIGNHGCQRDRKDGETVVGCDQSQCTDCITREYVRRLKRGGTMMTAATITHWPGSDSEVRDDLLSGKRSGSF
jgi:hypothetical protein